MIADGLFFPWIVLWRDIRREWRDMPPSTFRIGLRMDRSALPMLFPQSWDTSFRAGPWMRFYIKVLLAGPLVLWQALKLLTAQVMHARP